MTGVAAYTQKTVIETPALEVELVERYVDFQEVEHRPIDFVAGACRHAQSGYALA